MLPRRVLPCVVVVLLLGTACEGPPQNPGRPTSGDFPVTITDDEGAETSLDTPPDRIVTFAPSHTEIVFALGLGDRLVGISGPFDDHPPEAQRIQAVAGRSGVEPNIETVVSLEPDVVLTAFIGGEWKERLRELDIPVFTTLAASLEDTLDDIRTIGALVGAHDQASALVAGIREQSAAAKRGFGASDRVTCFLDLSDLFTVGPGSLEFDLLQQAGCEPVSASADDPYPQWSLEQLVQDDPDVYLVAEGVPVENVSRQPGIRELASVREGRIHEVNADLISRPGPRVGQGIEELVAALHGEPT